MSKRLRTVKKDKSIQLRVSEEWLEIIEAAAEKQGTTVSEFVRSSAMVWATNTLSLTKR